MICCLYDANVFRIRYEDFMQNDTLTSGLETLSSFGQFEI